METITSAEASSSRLQSAWAKPIAELLQDLHARDDNPVGRRFAVACHVSVSMALDIIERAEHDREQRGKTHGHQADVNAFREVLRAALGDCGREPSALSTWHRAPLSNSMVLKVVRAIGIAEEQSKLYNGSLEMLIDEFLTHLEYCMFRHHQRDTMPSFDATVEMRPLVAKEQIEARDLCVVLENFNSLDKHSSGGVRMRYKKIFEHQAAWLMAVSEGTYLGASRSLDDKLSDRERIELYTNVSTALYCASVQCGSAAMFSSGLLEPAEENTATDALYERNQHAAGALLLAFTVRYHRAHGRKIDPNGARSMIGTALSSDHSDSDEELGGHEAGSVARRDSHPMPQASDVRNPQKSDMFMPYSIFAIPPGYPGWPPPLGRAGVNGADADGFSKGVPDVMNLADAPWCKPDLLPLTWHRADVHGITLRIKFPIEDKYAPKVQQQRVEEANTAAHARKAVLKAIAEPHATVKDEELGKEEELEYIESIMNLSPIRETELMKVLAIQGWIHLWHLSYWCTTGARRPSLFRM